VEAEGDVVHDGAAAVGEIDALAAEQAVSEAGANEKTLPQSVIDYAILKNEIESGAGDAVTGGVAADLEAAACAPAHVFVGEETEDMPDMIPQPNMLEAIPDSKEPETSMPTHSEDFETVTVEAKGDVVHDGAAAVGEIVGFTGISGSGTDESDDAKRGQDLARNIPGHKKVGFLLV
jgi:hypothetical protein